MVKKIVLTGVKPTGTPHLGNYLGAIRPALELSKSSEYISYYFIADYHALTTIHDPKKFRQYCLEVAATWIALGLDPEKVVFYRQSDIKEIFELSWILACFTSKGLLNRAHAYKTLVQQNIDKGKKDLDYGVEMGVYSYPILMAADILLFEADIIPVGKDQVQHVEITRDIAQRINSRMGEILKLPNYIVQKGVDALPGTDGRKMSKSYDNTIPLFAPEKKLKKLINRIKTDSSPADAPKDPNNSMIFEIYKHFADDESIQNFKSQFENGISWGEAKKQLFEMINLELEGPRVIYQDIINNPKKLEEIIQAGSNKARKVAQANLEKITKTIGF